MKLRLFTLSLSIFISLFGLSLMGDFAIDLQAEGLQGRRLKEFDSVAETIRLDVKRQLDEFIQNENLRDYTDYQYFRVPAFGSNAVPVEIQQLAAERSPLGDNLSNGMAYGYFQMDTNGIITAPFLPGTDIEYLSEEPRHYVQNIVDNLKPKLGPIWTLPSTTSDLGQEELQEKESVGTETKVTGGFGGSKTKSRDNNSANYKIGSLDQKQQRSQYQNRSRENVALNIANEIQGINPVLFEQNMQAQGQFAGPPFDPNRLTSAGGQRASRRLSQQTLQESRGDDYSQIIPNRPFGGLQLDLSANEQVQVRVDPFQPVLVEPADPETDSGLFGAQVFMLRLVQIEERRVLQGFRLNTQSLRDIINTSARQAMSIYQGMSFDLSGSAGEQAAYTAFLDFGFGSLVVNLWELDPNWIMAEIS
ncbi:MAG: hypothetical protein GY869_30470, partial [Planctomycetes bacterium]|nr:hypothetical protein [Planctomycetota bacterium]